MRTDVVALALVLWLLATDWRCSLHLLSFAKQTPLRVVRDRVGTGLHSLASQDPTNGYEITGKEALLTANIAQAGNRRSWTEAEALFNAYAGRATQVYNSALTAAFRCGKNEAGTNIYNRMCSSDVPKSKPTYTMALKLFGKMRLREKVEEIWEEATQKGMVNQIVAGARIDAAAEDGDIEAAVGTLDIMYSTKLQPNVVHFSSAINACKNAEKRSPSAAMFLFETMVKANVTPTVATFSNLFGAHRGAPVEKLRSLQARMLELNIDQDTAAVESYLMALTCRQPSDKRWSSVEEAAIFLRNLDKDRLQEAASFLKKAQANGVRITRFSKLIAGALANLGMA